VLDPIADDSATGDQIAEAGLEPKYAEFFAANYPHAARIGAKYAVDPTLLLGLAAHESGYGTSDDTREQNNPLGMRPDGHTPTAFPSIEAAWQAWGREFGPRVLGVGSDARMFVDRLQEDHRTLYGPTRGGDYRGPYNSEPVPPDQRDWKTNVAGTIAGVRRRLRVWQNDSDNAP